MGLFRTAGAMAAISCILPMTARAQDAHRSPELERLAFYVGHWSETGRMRGDPGKPFQSISGGETCSWGAGGYAVTCREETSGPGGGWQGVYILSYDAAAQRYHVYGTEAPGSTVHAVGQVERNRWVWQTDPAPDGSRLRYTFAPAAAGARTMMVEAGGGAGWSTIVDITYTASMTDAQLADFADRYAAAWSSQHPERLAAFYAEQGSLQVNDAAPAVGRAAVRGTVAGFMAAFPDMRVRLDSVNRSDSGATFYWTWTGTNSGLGGTGKAVRLEGYEEWSFAPDGLIARSSGHYDDAEYQRQLKEGAPASVRTDAPPFDLAATRRIIEQQNDRFTRAHVAGDVVTIDSMFTSDATSLPPGAEPATGLAAIHGVTVEYLKSGITQFREETTGFYGNEDLVIDQGNYSVTYGPNHTVERGKYLNVWKRDGGRWKIQINVWNTSPAASSTSPRRSP